MTNPSGLYHIESVQCLSPEGLHRMAYKAWGDKDNPDVLVCVHGVTRVSDDFDVLAQALSSDFRIICPDIVGRGRSSWFRTGQHYQIPQYVSDIVTLLARINAGRLFFLGTSMGGMVGMGLASLPGNPVQRLIINDIGPDLQADALGRIGQYIGQAVKFATFEEAVLYIKEISPSFGNHTEQEWHKLCKDVLRQDKDGMWIRHYDLKLAESMQLTTAEVLQVMQEKLWAAYDAVACPTLLLRGTQSDLLSSQTAQKMTQRGPKATLVEFEQVGHAPTLVHANQIAVIKQFLLEK